MCTTVVPGGPLRIEESIGSPQTGVTDSFEPQCGCWELNHVLWKSRNGLFDTKLTLQPACSHLWPSQISPNCTWPCSLLFLTLLIQNQDTYSCWTRQNLTVNSHRSCPACVSSLSHNACGRAEWIKRKDMLSGLQSLLPAGRALCHLRTFHQSVDSLNFMYFSFSSAWCHLTKASQLDHQHHPHPYPPPPQTHIHTCTGQGSARMPFLT